MSGRQNRIGGAVGLEIDALWAALDSQRLLAGVNQRLRQTERGVYLDVPTCCDEATQGGEVATGSCCDLLTGDCTVTSSEGCLAGVFTAGAVCDPNPCAPPPPPPPPPVYGACCYFDGTCVVTTSASCSGPLARTWTPQATCGEVDCPPYGRCCFHQDPFGTTPAGSSCSYMTEADCLAMPNGVAVWEPGTCDELAGACPVGACCNPSTGQCVAAFAHTCPQGHTFTIHATCAQVTCSAPPATGACCVAATGACTEGTLAACDALGGTWTQGQLCQPNPCAQPAPIGRCCRLDGGNCQNETEAQCLANPGVWFWYADGDCQTGPVCPVMGACCDGLGGCTQTLAEDCPAAPGGQSRWNAYLACGALPNCDLGCCTTGGVSAASLQAECFAPGSWSGVPCAPAATGKCCSGPVCIGNGMTQAACDFYFGQWYEGQSCDGGMC